MESKDTGKPPKGQISRGVAVSPTHACAFTAALMTSARPRRFAGRDGATPRPPFPPFRRRDNKTGPEGGAALAAALPSLAALETLNLL